MTQARTDFIPESSPHDPHEYKWIWLQGHFPVLLVHMPEAQQSAAAFAVNAGHFHDPDDAPGIAHFLEHMLFLGSERWPAPESFGQFIQQNSGHYNAWTGTEHSNYYFSVQPSAFAEGLDRFSSLIREPRFDLDWVEKERQSIEAEYRLKQKDELRRLYEVHKATANSSHPFAKFSVGNAETLADQPDRAIRDRLKDFYIQHYCPRNSTLVLTGPQSLIDLEKLAHAYFDEFAMLPSPQRPSLPDVPMYNESDHGQVIYVRPIKQANRLIVTFPLPGINHDYMHKTTSFIAHLLGHESPGSLCFWLRDQLLITELSAGGGMSGYNFKDFTLNMQLTDAGMMRIDTILQACFQFIRTIAQKGLVDELYQERQQMLALAYRFPESIRPVDFASQLAINMLHYDPIHVVSGDYRMDGLNRSFAAEILEKMTPERARVTVIHQSVPVSKRTQYYHAEYSVSPLRVEQIELFQKDLAQTKFSIPAPNPYIPKRVEPLPFRGDLSEDRAPEYYNQAPGVQLWHRQECTSAAPHAHVYLSLQLPLANASVRNHAISRLWCELGQDALNERFYDAEVAGIHFNLYAQGSGITLHVAGFSDRQPALLRDLLTTLATLRPSAEQFYTTRDHMCRNWRAMHQHKPINYLFSLLHHRLQKGSYTAQQLAESIRDLDYEHYLNLLPGMLRDAQALLLTIGDIEATTSIELAHWIASNFPVEAMPKSRVARHVTRLERGCADVPFVSAHADAACAWFFQGQTTQLKEKANFLVLNQLFSPQFFNQLRTERQLGYLVGSSYVPMHGLPGLLCYVQSPHYSSNEIHQAMSDFIDDFMKNIENLDEETWLQAKQSVMSHLSERAVGLRARAQRAWSSIINNQGEFGLAEQVIAEVQQLQREAFPTFIESRLLSEASSMVLRSVNQAEK